MTLFDRTLARDSTSKHRHMICPSTSLRKSRALITESRDKKPEARRQKHFCKPPQDQSTMNRSLVIQYELHQSKLLKLADRLHPSQGDALKLTREDLRPAYSTAAISRKSSEKHVLFLPMGSPHFDWECPSTQNSTISEIVSSPTAPNLGGMWGRGTAVGDARKCS